MLQGVPHPRYRIYTTPRHYAAVLKDWLSGKLTAGDDVAGLEQSLAALLGTPHVLATAQARVAIYLAIKCLVGDRRKVIVSPYTIHEVINMVIAAGGVPVFADTDYGSCNIDAGAVEKLIDADTAAVMVTHLHGLACDVERIRAICDSRGVPLVEDAAQAFGTRVNGRMVGTFGDIGIYSFGLAKSINSFFGGAAVTRDPGLHAAMAREQDAFPAEGSKRLLGGMAQGLMTDITTYPPLFKTFSYWLFRFGYLHDLEFLNRRVRIEDNPVRRDTMPEQYKRRMTPSQARLVMAQLPGMDDQAAARIERGLAYHDGLSDIAEITLPPRRDDGSHTYMFFPILVPDREALMRHLLHNHRDCFVQHLKNCADLPCFEEFYRDCPNARGTAHANLRLPTYPRYPMADVHKTIAAVRAYFGR